MVSESETDTENFNFSNGSIPFEGPGVPPAIRQPLRDVQLHEGTDAIFQCNLAGNPKPRVSHLALKTPNLNHKSAMAESSNTV